MKSHEQSIASEGAKQVLHDTVRDEAFALARQLSSVVSEILLDNVEYVQHDLVDTNQDWFEMKKQQKSEKDYLLVEVGSKKKISQSDKEAPLDARVLDYIIVEPFADGVTAGRIFCHSSADGIVRLRTNIDAAYLGYYRDVDMLLDAIFDHDIADDPHYPTMVAGSNEIAALKNILSGK